MGALPEALEIIFEVQRKRNNEKNNKKNKLFKLQDGFSFFLFPPFFWTPLTLKPHNFFISYSF
jgi:hypothetical protein